MSRRIIDKYKECRDVYEVAGEFDISLSSVYRALRKAGLRVVKNRKLNYGYGQLGEEKPRISMAKEDALHKQIWDSILSTRPMRIV